MIESFRQPRRVVVPEGLVGYDATITLTEVAPEPKGWLELLLGRHSDEKPTFIVAIETEKRFENGLVDKRLFHFGVGYPEEMAYLVELHLFLSLAHPSAVFRWSNLTSIESGLLLSYYPDLRQYEVIGDYGPVRHPRFMLED